MPYNHDHKYSYVDPMIQANICGRKRDYMSWERVKY